MLANERQWNEVSKTVKNSSVGKVVPEKIGKHYFFPNRGSTKKPKPTTESPSQYRQLMMKI